MTSSGPSTTARRISKEKSLPITAAACSRSLSAGGSQSMRARSTSCTVSGAVRAVEAAPCSRAARASSSRKNGLPSAFARMSLARGSATSSFPKATRTTERLSWVATGWWAIWVAEHLVIQGEGDLVGDALRGVGLDETAGRPQNLEDREVGDSAPVREAVAFEIRGRLSREALTKLEQEPRLPDTGLTDERYELTLSLAG